MNALFKYIQTDKILGMGFGGSTLLIIITLIAVMLTYHRLPPVLPLFNQLPWGNERLGEKIQLFIPIAITCGVLLGNAIGMYFLYSRIPLVSRMLAVTSILISFLCFLFVIRTVQIML